MSANPTPELVIDNVTVTAPPAPWRAYAQAAAWWRRPGDAARDALAELLPAQLAAGATPLLTVGALIAYDDTPVGRYSEVVGMVVLRRGASVFTHVPFIAVDSRESVVGGRVNWALPKELATFDGAPDSAMHAHGDGWEVHMDARPRGPALPWLLPPLATLTQIDATGARVVARVSGYGRARRARITVDADGGDIADWFPIGTFDGTVSRMAGYLAAAK